MAAATLTLSRVEQAAVLRHIQLQRSRLGPDSPDGPVLDGILHHLHGPTTVALTRLEVFVMLRHLRVQRFKMGNDMMALEERRLRGGFNGELDTMHRLLDTDCTLLDDVVRRLWDMLAV